MSHRTVIIALFLFIAFGFWLQGLLWFVNSLPRETGDTKTPTDAIVILTGGSERLGSAIDLLDHKLARELFISGVGKDATIEAILAQSDTKLPDNMAQLLPRITLGYEAEDTKGNAVESANWLRKKGYRSVRLVTANYHIPRSMLEFRQQLPHIKIIPNPVFSNNVILDHWWDYSGTRKLLISEYHKYLAVKLRSLL